MIPQAAFTGKGYTMLLKWLAEILDLASEGSAKTLRSPALGNNATISPFPAKFRRLLLAGVGALTLLATLLILQVRNDPDDCIVLHDLGALPTTITKLHPAGGVQVVAFSPDGTLLASCWGIPWNPGACQLWDVARHQVRAVLPTASAVCTATFAPDGGTLALGCWDGTVTLWEVAAHREPPLRQFQAKRALALAFSPNSNVLVAGTHDAVVLWDLPTGRQRATFPGSSPLAFSPDGRTLATGKETAGTRLWDWRTGQTQGDLQESPAGRDTIPPVASRTLAFAPDGKTLISADHDGIVRLWDVEPQRLRARLFPYADQDVALTLSLAFSPDGHLLATGGIDRTVRLWDVQTGQPVATLQGHTGTIHGLAFAPDGQTLASGSLDRTVRLWDVAKRLGRANP